MIWCNESRTRFRLVRYVLVTGRVVDPGVQHFASESIIKLHGVDSLVLLKKREQLCMLSSTFHPKIQNFTITYLFQYNSIYISFNQHIFTGK
jgi:hypothetical protein